MYRYLQNRRRFLITTGVFASTLISAPGLFAEQLAITPDMTEGPFYPDHLPLDTDNDLIMLGDSITPAVGIITQLSGRVFGKNGSPIKNATVEIWQCDANKVYLHSRDSKPKASQQDKHFQGFGRFETNQAGEYRFRTIKPVEYPGRPAPHIHFKVKLGDRELLNTQLMIRDYPGNDRDGIFKNAARKFDRKLFEADFLPIPESKTGELFAKFDLVLGITPSEEQLNPPETNKRADS
ncbi:MAG: protocatechuate 3,4-dioxygenase [Planctomycetota bacterium]|nr:protocatechuate 3,4-dioxygenase [Planctomycetota bacterium]